MYPDPTFVFYIGERWASKMTAERFSGGVRLSFPLTRLTFAVWHSILHETPEGDLAPGFGPFEAELDERGDQ
jgi:hypothetical protein